MKKTRKGKLDTFIKKAIENEEDDGERTKSSSRKFDFCDKI